LKRSRDSLRRKAKASLFSRWASNMDSVKSSFQR
jgi:hypothetical protein